MSVFIPGSTRGLLRGARFVSVTNGCKIAPDKRICWVNRRRTSDTCLRGAIYRSKSRSYSISMGNSAHPRKGGDGIFLLYANLLLPIADPRLILIDLH